MNAPEAVVARLELPGKPVFEVRLSNWDGDTRWGVAFDAEGNRIEVLVFEGDPHADEPEAEVP